MTNGEKIDKLTQEVAQLKLSHTAMINTIKRLLDKLVIGGAIIFKDDDDV